MTCQLYRHFDAAGVLLYVGISLNAVNRLTQHNKKAEWANRIARVEVKTYPSVKAAKKAEKWAVESEAPLFNKRMATGLMSSAEVGERLGYTLADAYRLAREKGDVLTTIDPVEFATMDDVERRYHRRMFKRLAKASGVRPPSLPPELAAILFD